MLGIRKMVHATILGAATGPAIRGRALAGKTVHWTVFYIRLAPIG